MTDAQLLQMYGENGSEQAFRDLVDRHLNLVYSTARRLLNGDAHLAQDVTQSVFVDLARQARRRNRITIVGGWLYRHTFFTASKLARSHRRRAACEKKAMESSSTQSEMEAVWSQIAPILDQGLRALSVADRDALVLRFFEQQDLRAVGVALGVSEDAAQKRIARALEKLRVFFARRGTRLELGILASCLASQAVVSAPPLLGASVATAALEGGACVTAGFAGKFLITMGTFKLKSVGVGVLVTGLLTSIVVQQNRVSKLQREAAVLRSRAESETRAADDATRARAELENDEAARAEKEHRELLRLRGEVSVLRQQVQEPRFGNTTTNGVSPENPAENDTSPIETFRAALRSHIPQNHTLVTGGWETRPGRRMLVLLSPRIVRQLGNDPAISVQAKFLEAQEQVLADAGMGVYSTSEKETSRGGLISDEELTNILKSLEAPETDVRGAPRVTTLSGRQAQVQMVELRSVAGESIPVPLGPTVDIVPTIADDGKSVEMTVISTYTQMKPLQEGDSQ